MSEHESTICAICGHHKMIHYEGWRIPLSGESLSQWRREHPGERFTICPGHPEEHPPHKYCPKCGTWRDMDGACCGRCGTALVLKQLNEQSEPVAKHDGWLRPGSRVYHDTDGRHKPVVTIEGEYRSGPEDTVSLYPAQALSLLDWLIQEKPTLERMAKEQ